MVSLQQARTIITQRRQDVSQQRKELDTARRNIEQTQLAKLTRAELQVRGREQILARKRQLKQLEGLKRTQISQLKPFETELTSVVKDIGRFEKEVSSSEQKVAQSKKSQRAFEKAVKIFESDDPRAVFALTTSEEKRFFKLIQAQNKSKARKEFEKEQIKLDIKEQFVIPEDNGMKVTKFQEFVGNVKKILLGKEGEKFVGTDIIPDVLQGKFGTFLSKPDVTSADIQKTLRKGGLPGKVIGEFIPVTPGGALTFVSIGAIGGTSIPFISSGVRVGISALGGLTALDTSQAPETRIAGTIVAIAPFLSKKLIPPGKKGQASAFAELEKFFKKEKKKPLELNKVLDELKFTRVGKTVKEKSQGEKIADLRKIINKIKKTKDPKLQQEQLRGALRLYELNFGKTQARILFKDFLAQEGLVLKPQQVPLPRFTKVVTKPKKAVPVPVEAPQPQALQPGQNLFFLTEQQIKAQEKMKQPLLLGQIQPQVPKQIQPELLTQAQRTRQRQKQRQRVRLRVALRVVQAQRLKTKAKTKMIQKLVPIKPIIPKLPKGVLNTKLVQAVRKVGTGGMDILVGQKLKKQKVIGKNLHPFTALKLGQSFVDRDISASFKLVKSGKEAKGKKTKPFNLSPKFRPSKKNILFLVEKRKHRLDTRSEVRQLKAARRKGTKFPKGFFAPTKSKRRKKK